MGLIISIPIFDCFIYVFVSILCVYYVDIAYIMVIGILYI